MLCRYDFSIYSGFSGTLNKVFFPKSANASVQTFGLWGVFAIGFVTRPLGSVFFGHMADANSRKVRPSCENPEPHSM